MKVLFIMSAILFSLTAFTQDLQTPPAQQPVPPQHTIPPAPVAPAVPKKPETKIEYLLRISNTQSFETLAQDLYGKELESKIDQFPKEHHGIVKIAAERTAKGYNLQTNVNTALTSALSLKDQAEVEAFFKDPRNVNIHLALSKNRDTYMEVADGIYGEFITTFIKVQPVSSPRRAYLFFIDQESIHDADITALQLKLETLIRTETENLGVAKAKKKDVNSEILKVEDKITSVQIEQKLDEMTYYYKDFSTQDVKDYLARLRTPGVAKFYQTIYLTLSEGMIELAKKFVLNLKEAHREKIRQNI